ncbi:hypothetical protein [Halosimplex sp. J119]
MFTSTQKRSIAAICLALLATTAGCNVLSGTGDQSPASTSAVTDATPTDRNEPTATATSTEHPTASPPDSDSSAGASDGGGSDESVAVRGKNLPVDADRVLDRIERLHGVEVDSPTVTVTEYESRQIEAFPAPFYRAFGVTGNVTTAGQARQSGDVLLDAGADHPEKVLAHEFAHHVHLQKRWWPTGLESVPQDEQRAATSVTEGAAVYVTDAYVDEYDTDAVRDSKETRTDYENGNAALRLTTSHYLAGASYVDSQVTAPADLESVLSSPPGTTEAVLHPGRSVSLGHLTIDASESEFWAAKTGHFPSGADRRGELLVRELLRLELERAVADSAANGWDNDRSLTFSATSNERRRGIAWALRWENASEADEFAAAFDRFADRRNESVSGVFATERVARETVVVFAGNETFVENATANGTNESVSVVAPSVNGTASTDAARLASSD